MSGVSGMAQSRPALRKAEASVRRQQLIEATIAVLAARGYAALTIADVARQAGLSPGIVIFHFTSKDGLLAAALTALAEEYRNHWQGALRRAGPAPADRLTALLLSDFDTTVFTPERLAAWIAFWGEAQGRPVYDQICSSHDDERRASLEALCGALCAEGGYDHDPRLVMRALDAMSDGLWLALAASAARQPGRLTAAHAQKTIISALAAFFPNHCRPSGRDHAVPPSARS
jgi:AcrR family transcriptional regulator